MLGTVQTHWLDVCEYFTRVQCASTDDEEWELAQQLPRVEESLGIILDALLTEKQQVELDQHALQQRHDEVVSASGRATSLGSLASSVVLTTPSATPDRTLNNSRPAATANAADRSPSSAVMSFAETTSTTVLSPPQAILEDASLLPTMPFVLPPCYHYLFAPPPPSTTTSLNATPVEAGQNLRLPPLRQADGKVDDASNAAGLGAASPDDADLMPVFPDTISSSFLLTLCLFAKHNQPAGSRTVILRFLQGLIQQADLPMVVRHGQRGHTSMLGELSRNDGTAPPRSILQLSLTSSIVPLLDMIRKVGAELDPTHSRGGGIRASLGKSASADSRIPQEQTYGDADRTAFVEFLCALAERMEQVPDLANYFITSSARGDVVSAASRNGDTGTSEFFVLLEILLPYMTHDCTAAGWEQRRDTCRYALSAVLSLAKCPDTWVQDLVGRTTAIADRTLAAACTTLLTLCKIPDNDDSKVQLLYLRDVLRFWSAMCLSAPAVADALGIPAVVENDFAKTTLTSLLMSPDSRVYAAACLVTSVLVADLNTCGPVVPAALARAVLAGVVDVDTGRRARHRSCTDYYALMARRWRSDAGENGPPQEPRDDERLGSFFDFYVASRISAQPALTEEDLASQSMLSITLTEWTAVEATLTLLTSLAENCPYLFAKYAFLADMNELTTIRPRADLSASSSAPSIDVRGCFPAQLLTAEGTCREEICGVSTKQVSEEILESMLRIEANTPFGALYELQQAVSGAARRCVVAQTAGTQAPAAAADVDSPASTTEGNVWYHEPTAELAPLTKVLSDLLSHFMSIPFRSSILLTRLCVRVCLLPDLRVVYSLLDPDRGPWTKSLRRLGSCIDHEMAEDEKFAVAAAAAAAAAAGSVSTSFNTSALAPAAAKGAAEVMKEEGKRARSVSTGQPLDNASLVQVPPTTFTRAYLYELYLQYWEYLPAHLFNSLHDERDTRALASITTPPTVSSVVGAPGTLSDDALKGLIRHQPFLESCACLEQFKMELEAAVGYVTLSHSLMTLKV